MIALRASVIALSLFALTLHAREVTPPTVKLVSAKPGDPPAVEVTGFEKTYLTAIADAKPTAVEWSKIARLVVDSGTPEEVAKKPPIAGTWSVKGDALRFEPQFPLVPGKNYRVFADFSAIPRTKLKGDSFALSLSVPKPPPGPRVGITAVYPSTNRLPENTLRMYIHFSGPVERGNVYKYLKLVRADGTEVKTPFLEIEQELWSEDGTRLTILFDPGRVKRGLEPRAELGPILEEGLRYTLEIDASWRDLEGRPLLPAGLPSGAEGTAKPGQQAAHKKTFDAIAPDDRPVAPNEWAMVAPRAGSDAPLMIRLAKPLDRALLGRMMWVADAVGEKVDGVFTVGGGERVVTFAPAKPWTKGNYTLVIDPRLEDICGNRVGEPFEIDVQKPNPPKPAEKIVERPFAVK